MLVCANSREPSIRRVADEVVVKLLPGSSQEELSPCEVALKLLGTLLLAVHVF